VRCRYVEAEIKKIVAYNKDTLKMPPPVPTDPDRTETVGLCSKFTHCLKPPGFNP
jgi:hypothetical protein